MGAIIWTVLFIIDSKVRSDVCGNPIHATILLGVQLAH